MGLGIFFLITGQSGAPSRQGLLGYTVSNGIPRYLLALQTLHLYVKDGRTFQRLMPLLGAIVFAGIGDVMVDAVVEHRVYLIGVLAFAALTCVHITLDRKVLPHPQQSRRIKRAIAYIGVLAVVSTLGGGSAIFTKYYEDDLDDLLVQAAGMMGQSGSVGFGHTASLTSVTSQRAEKGQKAALRIRAADMPGYLRGAAYDDVRGARWRKSTDRNRLTVDS